MSTNTITRFYSRRKQTADMKIEAGKALSPYSGGGGRQLCRSRLPGCRGSRLGTSVPTAIPAQRGRAWTIHAGQFTTFEEVLNHYQTAVNMSNSELEPFHLGEKQIAKIIAFLKTLVSSIHAEPQ